MRSSTRTGPTASGGCSRATSHWHTERHYYDRWRADGTWGRLNEALNVRVRARKEPTPSVLIVDSQSARSTEMGGEVGFDGRKKVKVRKRQLAVDTLGLLWRADQPNASAINAATRPLPPLR
jgi:hypothetical protein